MNRNAVKDIDFAGTATYPILIVSIEDGRVLVAYDGRDLDPHTVDLMGCWVQEGGRLSDPVSAVLEITPAGSNLKESVRCG